MLSSQKMLGEGKMMLRKIIFLSLDDIENKRRKKYKEKY